MFFTAYHVVKAAADAETYEVSVRFHRQVGTPSRGLLNRDWLLPRDDLAVVVVENPTAKSVIPLGSGTDVKVRDAVVAIGHPSASTWSVTEGRVSALPGKDVQFSGDAVNPGNSGGPLIDANGRMVGLVLATEGEHRTGHRGRRDHANRQALGWGAGVSHPAADGCHPGAYTTAGHHAETRRAGSHTGRSAAGDQGEGRKGDGAGAGGGICDGK